MELFLGTVPPSNALTPILYRQVNLYAHQRFPHNLTFVKNLLIAYRVKETYDFAAYQKLLRENWFYDPQLRTEFFELLSKLGWLSKELASLPPPPSAAATHNVASLRFSSEGRAWLADFENAAQAFVELAAVTPGDQEPTARAISVERSLAASVPGAFQTAVRLAERHAKAQPADATASTEVGEIYADRELYSKAAPWWNRVAAIHPGGTSGYLDSATIFWDYFQFKDASRVISEARHEFAQPSLLGYQAGVIQENEGNLGAAIDEYLNTVIDSPKGDNQSDSALAESRLLKLASLPKTQGIIEEKTAGLPERNPLNRPQYGSV